MFNTYEIDKTPCPECGALELVYLQSCGGVHCQECGTWFDVEGNILENEETMQDSTITVEIPAGMSAAEFKNRLAMISNPEWIASWWHISDVHIHANILEGIDSDEADEITDDEAREVLRLADKYHDAGQGINWDVLEGWIDHVKQNRKAAA